MIVHSTIFPRMPIMPPAPTPLLEVSNLVVRYGAIEAIHGISLRVFPSQIVTLIGANGAGKSSLVRTHSGLVRAHDGHITYRRTDGRTWELAGTPAHRIVELGISHVPEGRGIFPQMTVQENLDLGAYLRR